jgi:transposase-like protein
MREYHAQFCEKLKGWFLQLTHPYIKVKGKWGYLYRAVDKFGDTIDFMQPLPTINESEGVPYF